MARLTKPVPRTLVSTRREIEIRLEELAKVRQELADMYAGGAWDDESLSWDSLYEETEDTLRWVLNVMDGGDPGKVVRRNSP